MKSPHSRRKEKEQTFHINGIKAWHNEVVVIGENPNVLPFEPQEVSIPSIGDQVTSSQREELQLLLQEHNQQSLIPLPATQGRRAQDQDWGWQASPYHTSRAKFKMRCKQCCQQALGHPLWCLKMAVSGYPWIISA